RLVAQKPGHRSRVYNRGARLEVGHGGLRHVKITIKVGFHRAIELRFGEVLEAGDMKLEGGVVNENVEAAELFDGLRYCTLAETAVGDVALENDAILSFGFHGFARDLGILRFGEVHDRDVRAFACEQNG